MLKPAVITENAMLFKDITQWIRNKTFLLLFFGLLFGSGLISFFVVSFSGESSQVGSASFTIYATILFLYSMSIAFMGFNLTSREFVNKTFELYELSGMSLERMILGKILSLMTQFFFGYFCIVPFMFFSYLLGGLDFVSIFGVSFLMIVFSVPTYLAVLMISLSSKTVKIGILGRIIAIIALLYLGSGFLTLFFFRHSPLRGISDIFKALFLFDLKALKALAAFFLFYFQICLLLFYSCCHFISSVNDSRELQIKSLLVTLSLSWLFLLLGIYGKDLIASGGEAYYLIYNPIYIMILIIGTLFYYHCFHPPIINRNRQKQARGFRRAFYYLFQPGAAGTHRLILYMLAIVTISVVCLLFFANPDKKDKIFLLNAFSLCLQTPFFLALPGGFLLCLRSLQKPTKGVKAVIIIWWALAGALLLVAYGIFESYGRYRYAHFKNVLEFLALLLSPLSSIFIGLNSRSVFHELAYIIRAGLGTLGVVFMIQIQRRRRKLNEISTSATL